MNLLKKLYIIALFILTSSWGQSEPSIQLISRSFPDKVLLRWAVDKPFEWKKANTFGFLIERATISRNGEAVVPIERQMLTPTPLKPKPIEQWADLANQDKNVAVLAQALYGSSFETTTPNTGTIGKITAVNDELEQRFTFGLLAAEQNFKGALLAGWAFEDRTISPNEKYLYKISVALPDESALIIQDGSVYAGAAFFEELPAPIGFTGMFKDSHVLLSWDFDLLSDTYTNYIVERSEDGKNYQQQNKNPIFNASKVKGSNAVNMFYTDSIPNDKRFYYRVKGKTAFGETGPPTKPFDGKAMQALGFVPRIAYKEIPNDSTAILKWDFKEEGNALISGFELRRGNKVEGPFTTVQKNIAPTIRETTFKGLKRINYFTIVAMGKNGIESPSFATIVQPVDSLPPNPPTLLKGVIDTTGIVTLSWAKNVENDLSGYRIFRSNNPNLEFSEVTNKTLKREYYSDTVVATSLNKKIYYKLQAEDLRYNRSKFSKMLVVDMPDITPPSPPVLKHYQLKQNKVVLEWIPSSSEDVISHHVYRKNLNKANVLWEELSTIPVENVQIFIDSTASGNTQYAYSIIAKNESGLESSPSAPITINIKAKLNEKLISKFIGVANRELRYILLTWKTNQNVSELKLYRAPASESLKLFKTLKENTLRYTDYELQINNTYQYGIQAILKDGTLTKVQKISIKY